MDTHSSRGGMSGGTRSDQLGAPSYQAPQTAMASTTGVLSGFVLSVGDELLSGLYHVLMPTLRTHFGLSLAQVGLPVHYRDARTNDMVEKVFGRVPRLRAEVPQERGQGLARGERGHAGGGAAQVEVELAVGEVGAQLVRGVDGQSALAHACHSGEDGHPGAACACRAPESCWLFPL